jgi:RNA polymerase sigma-70 factor (ECF subfamily)
VFRIVFDHYKTPFFSAAYKMTRSADIAQEVVQEVFVTSWVKRQLIAASRRPQDYLFTILHNCIYAHFRKLAQERQLKLKLAQHEQQTEYQIEELLNEKENTALLEDMISQLPPQQKLIYKMAKQEGLSRAEIAEKLNISSHTVKNHLHAAVEYLRCYFKKDASAIIWLTIWMNL